MTLEDEKRAGDAMTPQDLTPQTYRTVADDGPPGRRGGVVNPLDGIAAGTATYLIGDTFDRMAELPDA